MRYEREATQRIELGTVHVNPDCWWSGTLTIPQDDSGITPVELTRHGEPKEDNMPRTALLRGSLVALLLLVGACTDRVTGPTIAPAAPPTAMIATTCTAIGECQTDDP
jgi:hypothetical protein